LQGEIHHVVNPDPYRGIFGTDANLYAKDVQDHIDFGTSGKVAGFIAETIQVFFFFFFFFFMGGLYSEV
jgi:alanine-glyoxylate transaminase/(R)-3-amino-2-methylpropionate-pyruvate transaminase